MLPPTIVCTSDSEWQGNLSHPIHLIGCSLDHREERLPFLDDIRRELRPPVIQNSFQLPAAEMRTAIDVQDVTSDRRGVGQVHHRVHYVLDRRGSTHR